MELFKYRNLVLGCLTFLASLFISFYIAVPIRVTTLCLSGVVFLLLTIIHLIKRGRKSLYALCHYTPSLILIILSMIISLIAFNNRKLEKYCDGSEHVVKGTVTHVSYSSKHFGIYKVELNEIDSISVDGKFKMTAYSKPLSRGDVIKATGVFNIIEHSSIGFDEASYLLSDGITVAFESDKCTTEASAKAPIKDFLEKASTTLDARFERVGDSKTHDMLSALFLGNKTHLSDSVKRDFTKIGLSHVLALSGMHITIIVTLLGFSLIPLPIPRMAKELLLILATFLFVGITGFSESALRAGIMVSLVYAFFFIGNRISLTSSLFYSVFLICLFDPYSIFSFSLILSFFAMLGCLASSKFIHRVRFLRKLRCKFLKFIVFTFISSSIACIFTLPIISVMFGSLAILSPITNIVISPLLSLLIYLSPIYLMVASIPYVSVGVGFVCTKITDFATLLGRQFSSIDHSTLPIINAVQFFGILILSVFLFGVLASKKKHCLFMIGGCILGILVFIGGTASLFIQRSNSVYVGGYSFGDNDIVFIEDNNEITVFDITNTKSNHYTYTNDVAAHLGYSEINNYIITDYSTTTHICFDNLSNHTVVKQAYVPQPQNENESLVYSQICEIAKSKGISLHFTGTTLETQNARVTFANSSYLPRTSKRVIAFTIESGSSRLTYLGAGSFELCDYFIDEASYQSDIIIFGAYGEYKCKYEYKAPYLDYCVFFGNSHEYASEEFKEYVKGKETGATRFCIFSN